MVIREERIMKARLVPLYFRTGRDDEFEAQLNTLRDLLAEEAKILEPVALDSQLPEAEAALFPQLLGDAYTQVGELKEINCRFSSSRLNSAQSLCGIGRLIAS